MVANLLLFLFVFCKILTSLLFSPFPSLFISKYHIFFIYPILPNTLCFLSDTPWGSFSLARTKNDQVPTCAFMLSLALSGGDFVCAASKSIHPPCSFFQACPLHLPSHRLEGCGSSLEFVYIFSSSYR